MLTLPFDAPHEPIVPVAQEGDTLGEVLLKRAEATPQAPASFHKRQGTWQGLSWEGLRDRSLAVSRGLVDLGIDVGQVVAILGPTQIQWTVFDLGAHLAGLVTVGVYPNQSVDQVRYLLQHSESRVVFVDEAHELETVMEAVRDLDDPPYVVPWNEELYAAQGQEPSMPRLLSPSVFDAEALTIDDSRQRLARVQASDTAVLVYTSGTTGPPKGAMISHANIVSVLRASQDFLPFYRDDLMMAFLPLAHVTQRILAFYVRLNSGVASAYASNIGAVLAEVGEIRPTIFGSVPRIYEKAYAKVFSELQHKSALVRSIFHWALGVGQRRADLQLAGRPIPWLLAWQDRLAHRLVFHKIHAAFGGRVRLFLTGAAPTAPAILNFFWATGLPLCEAYGMTEATVVTHINNLTSTRLGTVGQTIAANQCRIADDGEVLIKGPFVFQGYLKHPEATAETIVDGWLHTGDIGQLDDDGFLRITDRKKHLIITAGGKNVAPATIEGAIKTQSPYISQVHAHGDRRPYVSALIAPSPLETLAWGQDHGVLDVDEVSARSAELLAEPTRRSDALAAAMGKVTAERAFQELFLEPVRQGNRQLARVERVRRFIVHPRDFSHEGGELTPTMKVKRKTVEEMYADLFTKIYDDDSFAMDVGGEG